MKRTLILFLLALITGCSPVMIVQPNIDKNKNIETESKTIESNKTNDIDIETTKNEVIFDNSKSSKPKFDNEKSVREGIRNSYIYLIFKDEYKIRINGLDEKIFKSLVNQDINTINNLIIKNNIQKIEPHDSYFIKSEDELEKEEKASEKLYDMDYPNKGSIYTLHVENINVKSFVEELRKNELVLSANENNG